MNDDFKEEIARVSKLCSEAHHTAVASEFMGVSGKKYADRRDELLAHIRAACLAKDEDRPKHLEILRGIV